jgi:GNAT superfamily N-acetyltransferase
MRLFAVDSDMQGKGIARELLQFSEKFTSSAGGTATCLHARKGVVSQAAFYKVCNYIRDRSGDLSNKVTNDGASASGRSHLKA